MEDSAADRPAEYPADRSLTEVTAGLVQGGFDAAFELDEHTGACTCCSCSTVSGPEEIVVVSSERVEGASDPAEMSSILSVQCPKCAARGVIISRYGPEATEGEAALLRAARGANRRDG